MLRHQETWHWDRQLANIVPMHQKKIPLYVHDSVTDEVNDNKRPS